MSLYRYSALTTKVKAMNGRLLTQEQFRQMSDLHSVPEIVSYLKKIPSYEKVFAGQDETLLHRGAAEVLVKQSFYEDFGKLYRFCDMQQRVFLKDYFMRYEIKALKLVLRYLFDEREDRPDIDLSAYRERFQKHTVLNPLTLVQAENIEGLAQALGDTPYGRVIRQVYSREDANLFDYESALDLFFFRNIWQDVKNHLKKDDLETVRRAIGVEADMLNIQWIYRAKKYYRMAPADIYSMIIPVHYKISMQQQKQMAEADSEKSLIEILEAGGYASQFQEAQPEQLEKLCDRLLERVHALNMRTKPYSAACLDTYLYRKEEEVNRIIKVMECVRYALPAEKMKEYLS